MQRQNKNKHMEKCVPNKPNYTARMEEMEVKTSYGIQCAMHYVYSAKLLFGVTAFSKGHEKLIAFSRKKAEFDFD